MRNLNKKNYNYNGNIENISFNEDFVFPEDLDTKLSLIQELIPLGLEAVRDILQEEVNRLVGIKYDRNRESKDLVRWGSQGGSVYLGDQKVKIKVPRVRNKEMNREEILSTYQKLQEPYNSDHQLLKKVLHGISCHQYAKTARMIPGVFGMSSSSVSRRFIKVSKQELKNFQKRRLEQYDIVGVLLDGKTFADDQMIIGVGITIEGEKIFLGFVQTSTENSRVCSEFLQSLIERGLSYRQGLLFIIDGSKGIRKAIKTIFGHYALIQRCQWHKRENVISYLPKSKQASMRKKLQRAYEKPTYGEARKELNRCRDELSLLNQSAVKSLEEGLEETLTLHKLNVFPQLGISLKTTNCLESINARISRLLYRITYWKNSNQKHRWLATALLEIEPNLRKIKGYKSLHLLRDALVKELKTQKINAA